METTLYRLYWWSLGLPFFTLTLILEETRKFFIREFPQSDIAKIIFYWSAFMLFLLQNKL